MKKSVKRTLVSLLSLILVVSSVDVSGLTVSASEKVSPSAVITAFENLTSDVYGQTIPVGAEESAISFPDTLMATVKKTVTTKTVSGNNATVSGSNVSGGNTETEEIVTTETTEVVEVIEVLDWKIDAANSDAESFVSDDSAYGYVYTYVPELKLTDSEGTALTIANGVALPEIYVRVGEPIDLLADAKFTVNYYLEVEPGSDARAIAVQNPKNPAETKYFLHMEEMSISGYGGKVVRGSYGVDTGTQGVISVETNKEAGNSSRRYDYAEPAHDYNKVTGSQVNGGEGTVTVDNSLTFNFYWKTVTYSECHYVETGTDGSTTGLIPYNGKYYKMLKTNEEKVTAANVGTTANIPNLSGTGEFEAYTALASQPSAYSTTGTVDAKGELCLYRFYDKRATTSYTERYYVEDETATTDYIKINVDGELITYRLHHENVVENAYVGGTATITDLSGTPAFSGYTLVDRGYLSSATVQDNDYTIVYQFYDKNPICNYSVVYYVEVYEHQKDGSNITVNVNGTDKYYNRIPDSAYNMACQAPEGTVITVADGSSDIPGVYAGGEKVSDTFKAYTSTLRKYSYDTTVAYNKHTGTVAADGSLQIVLFYDWLASLPTTAEYTQKYYVECENQSTTTYDIDVDGVKYELLYENEKIGTVGTEVEIGAITWENQENYYSLSATDEHASKAVIAVDGTTVLYQFYRLHPLYLVCYYRETEGGTLPVGGKNYSRDITTIFTGRTPKGTVVSYRKLDDGGAVITAGGTDVTNSSKTYDGYELNEEITNQYGNGSQTITGASGEIVELFFDKVVPTANYTINYYKEVGSGIAGAKPIGDKYYELQAAETITNSIAINTVLGFRTRNDGVVGVRANSADIDGTFKVFDGYKFSPEATIQNGADTITVTADATQNVIELFFDAEPAETVFTGKYYVEMEDQSATGSNIITIDGVKYELKDSYTSDKVKIGEIATIQDKSTEAPYSGYELLTQVAGYPSTTTVSEDTTIVLYQIYRLHPEYSVKYYTEADAGEAGAIQRGTKYYILTEYEKGRIPQGTALNYLEKTDGTVGVTADTAELINTFKSYANYLFNSEVTRQNNKYSVVVARNGENVIELFFDKARTASYRGEYYVEAENQNTSDYNKIINGVKYLLQDSYTVNGVAYDARVEIADKSAEYAALGYDLMQETAEYPSWIADVADSGTTVLYQIYRLKPKYIVHYYLEAEVETTGAVAVGGKYYLVQEADTFTKYPTEGTIVTYAVKADGMAGVAEDGVGLPESLRSYDGYEFSEAATLALGRTIGTVQRGNPAVIALCFNKIRADYKEKYWIEEPNAISDYITLRIGEEDKKFVLSETVLVEDVWIKDKVIVTDKSESYVSYTPVYEEIPGYSAVAYGINEDGTTEVHQIYVLKRTAPYEPEKIPESKPTNPQQAAPVQSKGTEEDNMLKQVASPKTGDRNNLLRAAVISCLGCIAMALAKMIRKKQ